ncbi:MAG: hypothetical protein ACP5XB_00650 [Isosphaeraceae bacterium]
MRRYGFLGKLLDNGKATNYSYDADNQFASANARSYAHDANGTPAAAGYTRTLEKPMLRGAAAFRRRAVAGRLGRPEDSAMARTILPAALGVIAALFAVSLVIEVRRFGGKR